MSDFRYDEPELFEALIRSAQYIARLKTHQDVWEHVGNLIVTFFPAAWTAFAEPDSTGGISIHHCTPGSVGIQGLLTDEVRTAVADVLESGFLALQVTHNPAASMTAFLPIVEEYRPAKVMLIAHQTSDPIPRKLLNIYLAIAGLAGTASERLHSEQELHKHRAYLEELVNERTAALRQEKAFSETAINSMPGVFYLFKEDGKFLRWNRNLEEVTGYSSLEIPVMSPLDFFSLPDREAIAAVIRRVFKEGAASVEASFSTKHGKKVPYYFTGFRLPVNGAPHLIGCGIDITELKRAQDHLRDAQKLESLGLLAGGVAHDFNNLLVGIIGNASLAQDALPPGHPAAELLDSVVKTSEKAAHLTRQMLAYSGKGHFLVEPVDLSNLVSEMSGLVQPSISRKIALHLDLTRDLPTIEVDRGQVEQVLMNLVLNAAESIGGNAGLISVKTGVREVDARDGLEARELSPGSYVWLEVRDTGCGMDDVTKARIFDPFFSTKFTGRGLGLAAVAGIVRGHRGVIEVTSEPGKGACFTILLPASVRTAEARPAAAVHEAPYGSGTVLVVDDEEIVRGFVKKALERYGFHVLLADSGPAAVDIFKRHPRQISAVLLDLSMPGMSGEEVLPALRRIRPEVKVIVSSGYSEAETMKLFRGHRVSGFVQKPYTAAELAKKVKDAIAETAAGAARKNR